MVAINRDFVVKNGIIIEGDTAVTSSTNQIDALQVAGGTAIAKNLIVGTTATIFGDTTLQRSLTIKGQTNLGGQLVPTTSGLSLGSPTSPFKDLYLTGNSLYVGNVILSSTGTIVLFSSTLSAVKLVTESAQFTSTTNSTSTNTGALIVNGGVGVAKDLYIGNNLTVGANSILNGSASLLSTLSVQGQSTFTDSTLASSAGTGAVKVAGGVRVANNVVILSTASNTGTLQSNALYVEGGVGINNGLAVSGTAVFKNDVYFQGATTYVYSTNTIYTDNILDLHVPLTGIDGTWIADDGKDIGFRFNYYNSSDKNALLLLSNNSKKLEFFSDSTEVNGVISNTVYGEFKTGAIQVANTTSNNGSTNTGALTVVGGVGIGKDLRVGGTLTATNISFYSTVTNNGLIYQTPDGRLASQSTVFYNTLTQILIGTISRSQNLTGGQTGSIPIQTNNGVTTFIDPGSSQGQVLLWNLSSNTAEWGFATQGSVESASTASHLAAGLAGNIVYQSAAGRTTFLANGANGSVLTFNATSSAPQWSTASTLTVGYANTATTALFATTATRALLADTATYALLANTATTSLFATTATYALLANTATTSLFATTATRALLADTATLALLANTATYALFAGTATRALLADTATRALLADTATLALLANTATYALLAETSTHALLADTATLALLANTATYAITATFATSATYAFTATYAEIGGSSNYALFAGTATHALLADTATYALLAETSTHALLADTATLALLANTATYALTAETSTHALLADTATLALLANTATYALLATTATYALNGGTSTYALLANTATYALLAETSTHALLADTATLALLANTATYALLAETSTHALLADTATLALLANTATNIAGGVKGSVPYQTTSGVTTFLGIGTSTYILTSNGMAPEWTSLGNLSSGNTAFADNVKGGAAGQLVYQLTTSSTGFAGPGTAGQILTSNGTSGPQYTNTSSIRVGYADTATTALLATTATLALNATTATLALNATTATYANNILGGSAGSLVYQTGTNATVLLAGGSANSILTYVNNAPVWSNTSTLSGGIASSSTVNGQTLKISNGGLGVIGDSYFANYVGIGGSINVANTSYVNGSKILTAGDLDTVTFTPTYITNDPTSQTGLATIANTTTVYGTYNFGTVTDISTINDYNTGTNTGFYSINDAAGAPAYVVYIGFANVTDFTRLVLNINYTAQSGHTVEIDLYNYVTLTWDTFTTFSGSTSWFQFILAVIDSTPYMSGGKVVARIYHVSAGNTAHRTWIDYAALENSVQGGQGPRGVTGATGATGAQGLTTTTTSTFIFNNATDSSSTITGAVTVVGGVGIGKTLNVGSSATILSTAASTATLQNNALYVAGGVGIASSLFVTGPAVFQNNVIFSGTTTYVLSTNTVYTDNIIELHYNSNWFSNDGKDIGLRFHYYDTADRNAFLGRDNASGYLEWVTDSSADNTNNITGTNGTFRTGSIILTDTTASSSTITGVLQVAGGVGIGGAVYIGNTSYIAGAQIITTATVNQYASQTTVFAGTDTAVNTSTGAVTVWNTSTLQTVTSRGATTNNAVSITNTTASTGTSTGALKVAGGVGVAGSVYVGNRVGFTNASNVSAVYQYYNTATNSLDTVFG